MGINVVCDDTKEEKGTKKEEEVKSPGLAMKIQSLKPQGTDLQGEITHLGSGLVRSTV